MLSIMREDEVVRAIDQDMRPGELLLKREGHGLCLGVITDTQVRDEEARRYRDDEGKERYESSRLFLAPSPRFIIRRGPNARGIVVTYQEAPIVLKREFHGSFERFGRSVDLAVGNHDVAEFLLTYHDLSERRVDWQEGFLRVITHLKISDFPQLDRIRDGVAKAILPPLVRYSGTERVLREKVYAKPIAEFSNDSMKVVTSHMEPGEFADYVIHFFAAADALQALNRLTDAGLIGHGLILEVDLGEGERVTLNLDHYFQVLAQYYEPRIYPRSVEKDSRSFV